jgi:two-component sensor histidine kinase
MLTKILGSWWSTIESRLIVLVIASLVPLIGVSAVIAMRYAEAERKVIEARRVDVMNNLTFLVDGEVAAVKSLLSSLAKSPDLLRGDFTAFRAYAETLIGDRIAVIALLNPSGQQLMSTFIAPGQALPKRDDMSVFEGVFRGHVLISDVIQGTAVRRPIISIAVPVMRDGAPAYAVSAVIYPERLLDLFSRAEVNPQWAAAVVDRNGRFVARNLNPERFIGAMARPELAAAARGSSDSGTFENTTHEGVQTANSFRRSKLTGWTSVVSVPSTLLAEAGRKAIDWMFGAAASAIVLSIVLASFLAGRIAKSIQSFSDAATSLVQGKPLSETPGYIKELAEVRAAFEVTQVAIAARKRADQHTRLLLRELSHRSKNLITVIQAIANQSLRAATSLDEFRTSFAHRLRGLAISHDVLVDQDWEGASLENLVRDHLAPFVDASSTRVEVSCPGVILTPKATQAIGLALHELATNAIKYGALSQASGKVTVTSSIAIDEPGLPLQINWVESGGPLVRPPTRKGFGQIVIDKMASSSVAGRVHLDYDPEGLRWTLLMPTEHFIVDLNASIPAPKSTRHKPNQIVGETA